MDIKYNGNYLTDTSKSLHSYGIKVGDTLTLYSTATFKLYIKVMVPSDTGQPKLRDAGTHEGYFRISGDIGEIKSVVEKMERIPKDELRVIFAGKELKEETPIGKYGLS